MYVYMYSMHLVKTTLERRGPIGEQPLGVKTARTARASCRRLWYRGRILHIGNIAGDCGIGYRDCGIEKSADRGKILHTRNRHLSSHRGCSNGIELL